MIALDTSAILAILIAEPEEDDFLRILANAATVVGAPTLVEARLVLESRLPGNAEAVLRDFIAKRGLTVVAFDQAMFEAALDAFTRYGKGRGHPAQLNFGDCFSYAVARTYAVPLLFKGNDFVHTDLVPAYAPAP